MKDLAELPQGWIVATLADIARWGSGGTPSRAHPEYYGGKIPWLKTGELGRGPILDTEEKITEQGLANSSAKIFPKGSVALAMYGATIGRAAILAIDAATNQACAVGIPITGLTTAEYLFHYLNSQKEEFIATGKGGAQPNISQGVVRDWPIPLAPLSEQIRIANRLTKLIERVEACKARLDRVPHILKRFREAVLEAAVSGKLTEEWRALHPKAQCWRMVKLDQLCKSITDGDHQAPPVSVSGVPFITISAINDGRLHLDGATRYVPHAYFDGLKSERRAEIGDILFSVTGSIGIPALVDTSEKFVFQRHIAILKPDLSKISSRFLLYTMASPRIQRQSRNVATGTAQLTIPLSGLRAFELTVPGADEQEEIVRHVDELLSYASKVEGQHRIATERLHSLVPSLLAKAFRGELVPQDPADEPASAWLEGIRSGHARTEAAAQIATNSVAKQSLSNEMVVRPIPEQSTRMSTRAVRRASKAPKKLGSRA